jgi:hypothetical protein
MRHYRVASGGYCQFQYEIVSGVAQKWPPKKEDIVRHCHVTDIVNESRDIPRIELQGVSMPQQRRFVFQEKRNGDRNVELAPTKRGDDFE